MKTDSRLWLLFVACMAVVLFCTPRYAGAHDPAEIESYANAESGASHPSGLYEIAALPGASATSYYVVSNDLYVLMQKPMAKTYGAFSMVPVIVSDVVDSSAVDAESAGLVLGDSLQVDTSSVVNRADTKNQKRPGIELAMHMDFKEEAGKSQELEPDFEAPHDSEHGNEYIADPLEPINRFFFDFNDKVYFWAMKPAARAYSYFVPDWGRLRVRNFFDNIQSPISLINALLQFNLHKFGAEFGKFVLNSTVGIGGLFDIASRHPELTISKEDLGQTFGFYGVGEGFYLVLPFLGPSSLRDTVGTVGDRFLDPVWYITPLRDAVAVRSFEGVSDTSFRIGDYEDIKEAAVDPYFSVRDMYKQYRRNKIRE